MMSPRRFAGAALAGLAVVLAGCSSTPAADGAATATVTATPSTPDGVAGAFAAAYAAGDTPTACSYAGGYALQHMTELGQCAHTQWPAVQYWPGRVCLFSKDNPNLTADDLGRQVFQFHTNGQVNGFPDFVVGVQPSGSSWRVTEVASDTTAERGMSAECAAAALSNPTTGPSS